MSKIGRNYFTLVNGAGNTPIDTAGIVNVTEKFSVPRSELKSAISIVAAPGVPGTLTFTFVGGYAVGDKVRVTITSNITTRQLWRKSYSHTVVAGGTATTAIATAVGALIAADVNPNAPYASAIVGGSTVTVTQLDDDKHGLVGYDYTDSAAGSITPGGVATTISEGQTADLIDKGVDPALAALAPFTTVRIEFHSEAAIPFIDSSGATSKEIYWYGTPAQATALLLVIP